MGEPRERPILFSGPMIRALLEGRKTQTRRLVRCGAPNSRNAEWDEEANRVGATASPYGKPGDLLWVRETWGLRAHGDYTDWYRDKVDEDLSDRWCVDYRADWTHPFEECFWRPSIYMPRWASRIALAVTSVRVERLHDINEEDARAEGVDAAPFCRAGRAAGHEHVEAFEGLWDSINGKRIGCAWRDNPWVWVVGFERRT